MTMTPDLITRLEAAAEALEPFAVEADEWPFGISDTFPPFLSSRLTLGDFRRARDALKALRALTPTKEGSEDHGV